MPCHPYLIEIILWLICRFILEQIWQTAVLKLDSTVSNILLKLIIPISCTRLNIHDSVSWVKNWNASKESCIPEIWILGCFSLKKSNKVNLYLFSVYLETSETCCFISCCFFARIQITGNMCWIKNTKWKPECFKSTRIKCSLLAFLHAICCCSVTKSCPTLCDPVDYSTPGFPVLHHLLEFAQTHVHCISDAIQPSHPLFPPSPPALNLS